MRKILLTLFGLLILSYLSMGQEMEVSGIVKDSLGIALPGVTVMEKGTTNGVVTNEDGTYLIRSNSNGILQFSFVGYIIQEVMIEGNSRIDILLSEQVLAIDEVLVTALGISQAKKSIGYATQQIEPRVFTSVNTPNVGNLLSGQIAGMTVNNPTGLFQAPQISLRGKTPLIVVDEVPVSTDFFDITAADIADITILKGTTASALYGSRGRNGAILITTKNAVKEGLSVTISNSTMVTAGYTVFPETQTDYGNGSNGLYEFWDGKDGGISDGDMIWGPKFESGVNVPQWNSPIHDNVTGENIPWWGDVSGTQYDDKSRYSRVATPWEYHNNLKDFMGTGWVNTSNISIAYRGDRVRTRFSSTYSNQKGQVPNSNLQTGGFTFTSSFDLTKKLVLESKIAYNKVYSPNYPRHGYGPRNHMYTLLIWMGDDVNGKDLDAHRYITGQEGYRQANFNYAWYNNVYFAAYELNQKYDRNVINSQMKLTWKISDDLTLLGRAAPVIKDIFENRESPKSYLNYGDPRDGDYKTWNTRTMTFDYDALASYQKKFTSNLNFSVNAGASSFYSTNQVEYNATDGIIVPYVYSLNNTKGNVKASTYLRQKTVRSIYGTTSIDLFDAFFLDVAVRNDWSSTLPVSNNSYFYPSVSLSSIISNLVNLPEAFDYLKVYGSMAVVSNDLDPYQISSYYNNSGSYGGLSRLYYPSGIINPDIEPEKSTSYEFGLSSSFFKDRMNFEFTYFNVLDENQIINLPISEASGFTSRKLNGNEYTTNGLEFVLELNPVRQQNLRWDISLNWSTRVKRITSIYGDEEKFGNYSLNERVDNYYATGWLKNPDGELILSASTGLPTKDPFPQLFGHLDPDFRYGFQSVLDIKGVKFEVDLDGVWGGVMRSLTVEKMWWGGKHPESTTYRDEEYAAGGPVYVAEGVNIVSGELTTDTEGYVISDTRVYQTNETLVSWQTWCQQYPYRAKVSQDESEVFANIFDRSFIKLRRLSIGYDMNKLLMAGGISNLDVSLYGYNLLILKRAKIIDPDFGHDNSLQDPSARYLGMSVKMSF